MLNRNIFPLLILQVDINNYIHTYLNVAMLCTKVCFVCDYRSDAPYPTPLFARDSVMSVDSQANHSQNYTSQAGNHGNPGFGQSEYLYQNRSFTPPTNQEVQQRLQQASRSYYYPETNTNVKDSAKSERSETKVVTSPDSGDYAASSPPVDKHRKPTPDSAQDKPTKPCPPLQPLGGEILAAYGSPLSSDKENKTSEQEDLKPEVPKPVECTTREAPQPLSDRSRSPQDPSPKAYPTKYPYDPHRASLKFPFSYPLERSELRPDLEPPKPVEATQGRPFSSTGSSDKQQHYTQHSSRPAPHSPHTETEGRHKDREEQLRETSNKVHTKTLTPL